MAKELTDRQILHRQYLQSPVWRDKRQEAIRHYGSICNRCGEHGTDIHHKTYERVGGAELMEDLEVLCRECHGAHHRAEKATRTKQRDINRSVDRRSMYRYLTAAQKRNLIRQFNLAGLADLSFKLVHGTDSQIPLAAAQLLGFSRFHGGAKRRIKRDHGWANDPSHPQYRKPKEDRYITLAEFKNLPNPLSAPSSSS